MMGTVKSKPAISSWTEVDTANEANAHCWTVQPVLRLAKLIIIGQKSFSNEYPTSNEAKAALQCFILDSIN
jgi:hypothetical protein